MGRMNDVDVRRSTVTASALDLLSKYLKVVLLVGLKRLVRYKGPKQQLATDVSCQGSSQVSQLTDT